MPQAGKANERQGSSNHTDSPLSWAASTPGNATAANNGALETMKYVDDALFNLSTSYLDTGFRTRQLLSDYYVENASFLKMDNLTLNYNFGKIKDTVGLNLSFMIQNVFTITKYSGIDPEIYLGVDQNFYPRPRIYSLGIGLTF